MQDKEVVAQKINHLKEMMMNPNRNEGSVLRIFYDIFKAADEGCDLVPGTADWLSEAASFFISPQLLRILFKLRLEVYGFLFAALSFTDIDDVIDDLSNGGVLKGTRSFPPGCFNKLKRELLNQPMMERASTSETKKRFNEELIEKNKLLVNFLSGNEPNVMKSLKDLIDDKRDVSDGESPLKCAQPPKPFNNLKRKSKTDIPETSSPAKILQLGRAGSTLAGPIYDEAISLPPISHRLAEKLKARCEFIEENSSGMQLYKLPITRRPPTRSSTTERWVFGKSCRTNVRQSKTILLMGATGSGKTTLINAMVNYILGVEWNDPFRFILISEKETSSIPNSQAHSQTATVTAYEIHYEVGFRIPYSLIIVDTPGYGDTKGIDRDREITDSIQQFFKDKKGIQELNAVGFTVQSALVRLTPSQKYIFESILAIFGNDVRDNIRFLVTFTDGPTPPVLEAIKEAKIAHQLDAHGQPQHHRFNNSGFLTSNEKDGDSDFSEMFWKMGVKSFESFFSGLTSMKTISLTLTNEVLEERKHISVSIEGLTLTVRKQLTKMEELRKTKQMIENHSDQIKANKNFKYSVTVSKGDKINITNGQCTTNCSKCSMSCHFPCTLSITADKQKCAAMGRDGFCKSCPLKCKWDLHLNQNYHWIFQDVTETRTYEEILKKYEEAVQRKLSTEGVVHALESELEQIKYDLKLDITTIAACLQRLDEIALRPDAFTATDYIRLMIQSETKEKKSGFLERISSLESLLDKAEMVKKIRAGESVLPEMESAAGQSCSGSKVTIKPQSVVKKTSSFPKALELAQQYAPGVKNDISSQQLSARKKYETRNLKNLPPSSSKDKSGWYSD